MCIFQREVEYLEYRIDVNTAPTKLQAIQQARNITELRALLGLLNYYGKFIPNLFTLIHPLNALLQQEARWKWTQECAIAFKRAKQSLSSDSVLAHYDMQFPLYLAGDASCYGI